MRLLKRKLEMRAAEVILMMTQFFLTMRYVRFMRSFRKQVGYWPSLARPRTYREKTQWRKIFDRNPMLPRLQDKLVAKEIVRAVAPEQKMPKVLWSGVDPEAIPFHQLNQPYVLKANHGCGMNVMVCEPRAVTQGELVNSGKNFLQKRHGMAYLEWAYQVIPPQLFIEELLGTPNGEPPLEYKIGLLNGKPIHITVARKTPSGTAYGYYRADWTRIPITVGNVPVIDDVSKPRSLHHMLSTAQAIGNLIDMVRVDFYEVDGEAYFGECTVYSVSGTLALRPRCIDFEWGACWDITQSNFFHSKIGIFLRIYRWALGCSVSAHVGQMREACQG